MTERNLSLPHDIPGTYLPQSKREAILRRKVPEVTNSSFVRASSHAGRAVYTPQLRFDRKTKVPYEEMLCMASFIDAGGFNLRLRVRHTYQERNDLRR
jgi:hypothetical protein